LAYGFNVARFGFSVSRSGFGVSGLAFRVWRFAFLGRGWLNKWKRINVERIYQSKAR